MLLCLVNIVDECVFNFEFFGRNIFRKGLLLYDWFCINGLNIRFIEKEIIFIKILN